MPWYSTLQFLYSYITWKDVAEILLCSSAIYYFSLLLRNDRQKNLLLYFYCYCTLLLSTWAFDLTVATTFLFITAPVALVLFIIYHQEALQKNFVMLRNSTPFKSAQISGDWLETLIGNCLTALNNNKTIYCVIEHKDSLEQIVTCPLPLQTDVQKNLLALLLDSQVFDSKKMIWVNSQGKLLGLNAAWNITFEESVMTDSVKNLDSWQQDALFFTAKTDAIVFKLCPETRSFDIVAQSKLFNNVNTSHALKTIEKYLMSGTQTQGAHYAFSTKKQSHKQHNS